MSLVPIKASYGIIIDGSASGYIVASRKQNQAGQFDTFTAYPVQGLQTSFRIGDGVLVFTVNRTSYVVSTIIHTDTAIQQIQEEERRRTVRTINRRPAPQQEKEAPAEILPTEKRSRGNIPSLANKLLAMHNGARGSKLNQLTMDSRLTNYAVNWCKTMASADDLYHSEFGNLMRTGRWQSVGENVHWHNKESFKEGYGRYPEGIDDPDLATHAHILYMNSPGHRRNILRENWDRAGVGFIWDGKNEKWWSCVVFGESKKNNQQSEGNK